MAGVYNPGLNRGQGIDPSAIYDRLAGMDQVRQERADNIQQSLQERGLEDQAIFDRWSGQKRAYSAEKAGKGIANSAPKQGGVGKVVSKVLGGFGF